jgi:predicted nucleic acid-binding protein
MAKRQGIPVKCSGNGELAEVSRVVDASVVVAWLLRLRSIPHPDDQHVRRTPPLTPKLPNAVRGHVRRGELDQRSGWDILHIFLWLALTRHATFSMLDRVWELRHNLTAYDAAYVALAETLQCPLVTGDARISRASGLRCPVTVLPG